MKTILYFLLLTSSSILFSSECVDKTCFFSNEESYVCRNKVDEKVCVKSRYESK